MNMFVHKMIAGSCASTLCSCFRLVSGAGDIKLTKDGNVLLHEMVRTYQHFFILQNNTSVFVMVMVQGVMVMWNMNVGAHA